MKSPVPMAPPRPIMVDLGACQRLVEPALAGRDHGLGGGSCTAAIMSGGAGASAIAERAGAGALAAT